MFEFGQFISANGEG